MTAPTITSRGSVLIGPIQDALAAALASSAPLPFDTRSAAQLLTGVTVLTVATHEVIEEVQARQAGLKNSLLIFPPLILQCTQNVGGYLFWCDDIELRLGVHDNPKLNAAGLNAYALVERALYIVMLLQLTVNGGPLNPLLPDRATTRPTKDSVGNSFDLRFHTSAGISAPFPT
jgi:hypothetical protein